MTQDDVVLHALKVQLYKEYAQLITPERRALIESRARERTRYITVILEDLYQAHNMRAIIRSCDCFGIQDVHVVEQQHRYSLSKGIVKGAEQWLSIRRRQLREAHENAHLFAELRNAGYTIVATTPHKEDTLIDTLSLDTKIALIFGTELEGLSAYALEHADAYVKIPIYGFTESFNVSVAAGITLYELTKRLRKSDKNWRLSEVEQLDLQLEWLIKTTPFGDIVKRRLRELTLNS